MRKILLLLSTIILFGICYSQPANDNCASPVVINNLDGTCSTYNNTGATASGFTCAGVDGTNTVWYSFTAQGPNLTITVNGPANFRPEISLLDDACNATVCIALADGTGNYSSITLNENNILTAGVTYYFSVTTNNGAEGNFDVCLTNRVPSNCDGEDCSSPEPISIPSNGTQVCVNGCNTGATPGPNFSGTNCQDLPNATVWYQFTTNATTATVNVSVTSGDLGSPEFTIFRTTDCSTFTTIYCEEGSGGSVSENLIGVAANTTYLIAVSDVNGNEGDFSLCVTLNEDQSSCNTNSSLEVTATSMGSPLSGPFRPGEIVTFCYEISQWTLFNCNYLQGIVPSFGDCWDPVSFDAQGQPVLITQPLQTIATLATLTTGPPFFFPVNGACAGDPAGTWSWFPDGVVNYNNINNPNIPNGTNIGPGWYFLTNYDPQTGNCTPVPTNPNDSFGDGDGTCAASTMSGWRVCFQLQAKSIDACALGEIDCSVSIKTYADGEIGIWNNVGCTVDLPTVYPASLFCCTPDTVLLDTLYACDSIQIGANWYFSTGTATEVFQNVIGCDSFVITELVIFESQTTNESIEECDSAFVNGSWIFTSTTISLNDFTVDGCDSTHVINVVINNSDNTSSLTTSCNPLDTGIFVFNGINQYGCDSVHTSTINFAPSDTTFENLTSCNPTDTGVFVNSFINQFGCDSVHTRSVSLLLSDSTFINSTSCLPVDTGVFVSNNLNQFGCDSVHTITITLLPSDFTFVNQTSCIPADTGVFVSNNLNQFGCDSTHTVTISYLESDSTFENLTSCNPADVGSSVQDFTNQFGCDSVHTIITTLITGGSSVENITACDSVQISGNWYFTTTSFNDTLLGGSNNGCDSIVTYNITINQSSASNINEDICEGDILTIGGQDFTATGNYQITIPNASGCDSVINLSLNVETNSVPTFDALTPVCQGETAPILPTTSLNGISGTWSPAVNTATIGTFTYTFTPSVGQCISTTTLSLTVTEPITPSFNPIPDLCQGATAPVLPTTSLNGISGTWSPAINTNNQGTTTYTFTPTAGQCAVNTTLTISVTAPITPAFTFNTTYCQGDNAPALPTVSNNGISGSWNPPSINTASAGITTYTFTPNPSQCSNVITIDVTINQPLVPDFTPFDNVCQGYDATLPTVSPNGINGAWTPVPSSVVAGTFTYTFVPTIGQCAEQIIAQQTILPSDTSTVESITCFSSEAGISFTTLNNNLGCDSVIVEVRTLASNTYSVFPDYVAIRAGESVEFVINNEDDNLEFSWISTDGQVCDPPCENYLVTATEEVTNYYFTFVDTSTGCINNDTLRVDLEYFSELNVPNIFTPNNDGQNDVYRAYGTDLFDYSMMIFDRWGGKLFETTNINEGWDGNFKGKPVASGVYVVIIQAAGLDTKKYEITQNFKLVR
jgi:gliding motility-associated-like protein